MPVDTFETPERLESLEKIVDWESRIASYPEENKSNLLYSLICFRNDKIGFIKDAGIRYKYAIT